MARAAENGFEAPPSGDAAAEAPSPRLRNFQQLQHRVEQPGVAYPRHERGAPRRRRRLHGEGEHFRVGRLGVPASEALKPCLRLLADLARASAENRPKIGIFRDFARLVRTEIGAADGDRIFRPETKLLARSVGGEEQAAADLLARHVEKDGGGMQDRRLGPLETGRKQTFECAFAGRAWRLDGGIGGGRNGGRQGHGRPSRVSLIRLVKHKRVIFLVLTKLAGVRSP